MKNLSSKGSNLLGNQQTLAKKLEKHIVGIAGV